MAKASLEGRLAADAAFVLGHDDLAFRIGLIQFGLDLSALRRVAMAQLSPLS